MSLQLESTLDGLFSAQCPDSFKGEVHGFVHVTQLSLYCYSLSQHCMVYSVLSAQTPSRVKYMGLFMYYN